MTRPAEPPPWPASHRLATALALAACSAACDRIEPETRAAVRGLLAAEPAAWERAAAACAGHPDLGPALCEALPDALAAPGAQPAVALLGAVGGGGAAGTLAPILTSAPPRLAAEAALALGTLGRSEAVPLLEPVAGDPGRDVLVRTAAACALFDLGADELAAPLMHAILLAGTPAGTETAAEHGLPDKSRWALERNLVIAAIRRRFDHAFELDADSPWPRLRAGAERFVAALRKPQGRGDR